MLPNSQIQTGSWNLRLALPSQEGIFSDSEQSQMSTQDSYLPRAYRRNLVHREHMACWAPAHIDYNLDWRPSRGGDKRNCHLSVPFTSSISIVSCSYLNPQESCTARNTKKKGRPLKLQGLELLAANFLSFKRMISTFFLSTTLSMPMVGWRGAGSVSHQE